MTKQFDQMTDNASFNSKWVYLWLMYVLMYKKMEVTYADEMKGNVRTG